MRNVFRGIVIAMAVAASTALVAQTAQQTGQKPFEPSVGQGGKDVVWVPTPQALVEKMLDMAKVTPKDFVMDLGSGDGRTVITAAKRGATAPASNTTRTWWRCRARTRQMPACRRRRPSSRPTSSRPTSRRPTSSPCSCCPSINMRLRPTILEHEARHAHRRPTRSRWTTGKRTRRRRSKRTDELVHRAAVDRPRQGRGHLDRWQRDARTLTQKFQMLTGTLGIDRRHRPPARRRNHVHRGQRDLHGQVERHRDVRHDDPAGATVTGVRRRSSNELGRNRLRGSFRANITRTAGALALVVLVALLASPAGVSARQASS